MKDSVLFAIAFLLITAQSVRSQDPNDKNIRVNTYFGSNDFPARFRKSRFLPFAAGTSFLAGIWAGKTEDGALVEETWLPGVNSYSTTGTRRVSKGKSVVGFFRVIEGERSTGTPIVAVSYDCNKGDLVVLEAYKALYQRGSEAEFSFKPNPRKIKKVTYTMIDKEKGTMKVEVLFDSLPKKTYKLKRVADKKSDTIQPRTID